MLLFVFDHSCADRSITCAYEVMLLWCPLPWLWWAVFAGCGQQLWVSHTRHGWPPSARRGWARMGTWNHEITSPIVGVFVGLLSAVEWRNGPGRHGGWHRNHILSWPSLRGYSHILLEPFDSWNGLVCGVACGRRRSSIDAWPAVHMQSDWHRQSFQFSDLSLV